MHGAALHLAPILAAEKSRTPFYVAGGLLVAWALIVSLGLGLRQVNFPGNAAGERGVITITVILVLAAVSTAVLTSGPPAKAGATIASTPTVATPSPSVPAATAPTSSSAQPASTPSPSTSTAAPKSTSAAPKATTPTPAPATAATALKLTANPAGLLSFDTKSLSAKAGSVTITFTNNAPLEHNVTVAQGATVVGATPTFQAGVRALTLKLKPGTYTFYCSVPGHRQAGMEGTLNVS
jgi:plastocyanin